MPAPLSAAPQSPGTAVDLALSLTPSQVRAIGMLSTEDWTSSIRSPLNQRSCRVLRGLGLVRARAFETKWRLTPLGQEVQGLASEA